VNIYCNRVRNGSRYRYLRYRTLSTRRQFFFGVEFLNALSDRLRGPPKLREGQDEGEYSASRADVQPTRSHREWKPWPRCPPPIGFAANPPARSRAVLAGVRSVAPGQVTRSAPARWVCEEDQSGRGRRRRVARWLYVRELLSAAAPSASGRSQLCRSTSTIVTTCPACSAAHSAESPRGATVVAWSSS